MTDPAATFDRLCQHARETAMYESILSVLEWDERTMMPPAAGPYRAEQLTLLSGLVHKLRTEPQIGDWLNELLDSDLSKDPHADQGATIREMKRDYDKRIKLPQSLVEELMRASVLGQQAWVEARRDNDFKSFAPHLEKIFSLKRQQADALGYEDCRYDALLDEFEPGATTAGVRQVLEDLRKQLVPLIGEILQSDRAAPIDILRRSYPIASQEAFGRTVAARVGFEFPRGRLDITHHPFCSSLGPHDCRITTRYDEHWFPGAFFGILHEAGHGIYDQGLRPDLFGLPPGMFTSLGIHESQSRLWENLVGRSRGFWDYFFPETRQMFPSALSDVALDDFYFAINGVRASLIRVEADEATYNLHIIIRFELEQEILAGHLAVNDVPQAWNDKYQTYLGIRPPNDADGVLQDVHWSAGLVGYFPTYSLGNLYASQFLEQAERDLGKLSDLFARGEFRPLREWLTTNIHAVGRCFTAAELVQKVTGKPLSPEPLVRHLKSKLGTLHLANRI